MIFSYIISLQLEAYIPILLLQQFLRQNEIYQYINIAFLLIVNKPQPNLHPGHTCLGLGGVPQIHCSEADPGQRHGVPGGLAPAHLFLDQTEAQRAGKNFLTPLLPRYRRV